AAANLRGTTARKQAREETLELEVARLHRSLQAARDAVTTAAETAAIAKRLAEREEARIKLGTAVILDLITAQQSQRESELAKLRAEAQAERLALQLDHLTGTLLPRVAQEN
ncbi:MAG TPA: TolC family protein, partial [Myxococcota bacterium]|nr:TolC family protein [Myxococcota bacterium]